MSTTIRTDSLAGLPDWAQRTLHEHRGDTREYTYTIEEFEHAQTHDSYWNAAQGEIIASGKMHGYMHMYWGKRYWNGLDLPKKRLLRLSISTINTNLMAGILMDLPALPGAWGSTTGHGHAGLFSDRFVI